MDTLDFDTAASDEGLWLSISEIAAQKGLTRQSVAERVARFVTAGRITTREGKGRTKLVNLAAYDHAVGQTTSLGQVRRPVGVNSLGDPDRAVPMTGPLDAGANYTREQARRMAYMADLARLELNERTGRLLRKDDVERAVLNVGQELVRQFERLPSYADDIALSVGQDGAAGARRVLKEIAHSLRIHTSKGLAAMSTNSHQYVSADLEEDISLSYDNSSLPKSTPGF